MKFTIFIVWPRWPRRSDLRLLSNFWVQKASKSNSLKWPFDPQNSTCHITASEAMEVNDILLITKHNDTKWNKFSDLQTLCCKSLLRPTICHFQSKYSKDATTIFVLLDFKMAKIWRINTTLFSQVGGLHTHSPYIMVGAGPPKCPHSIANVLVNLVPL